jgi:hypothetical protein
VTRKGIHHLRDFTTIFLLQFQPVILAYHVSDVGRFESLFPQACQMGRPATTRRTGSIDDRLGTETWNKHIAAARAVTQRTRRRAGVSKGVWTAARPVEVTGNLVHVPAKVQSSAKTRKFGRGPKGAAALSRRPHGEQSLLQSPSTVYVQTGLDCHCRHA